MYHVRRGEMASHLLYIRHLPSDQIQRYFSAIFSYLHHQQEEQGFTSNRT